MAMDQHGDELFAVLLTMDQIKNVRFLIKGREGMAQADRSLESVEMWPGIQDPKIFKVEKDWVSGSAASDWVIDYLDIHRGQDIFPFLVVDLPCISRLIVTKDMRILRWDPEGFEQVG